jgi:heme exporter protein C
MHDGVAGLKSAEGFAQASQSAKKANLFLLIAGLFLLGGWGKGLFWVGADRDQGEVYRILFVHVPVAWCAFVWVITAAVFGVRLFLQPTQAERFDRSGQAAMELGMMFGALALATGSIWGRPTWGVWWIWDPRLTSTLVMFLVTCGYLILRSFTPDVKQKRTVSAVVALLAALNVPIVYFSVNLWRSIHQPQSVTRSSTLSGDIQWVLWFNVFAMLAFTIALYRARRQGVAAKETLQVLRAQQGA